MLKTRFYMFSMPVEIMIITFFVFFELKFKGLVIYLYGCEDIFLLNDWYLNVSRFALKLSALFNILRLIPEKL